MAGCSGAAAWHACNIAGTPDSQTALPPACCRTALADRPPYCRCLLPAFTQLLKRGTKTASMDVAADRTPSVLQPGSTVATALIEGAHVGHWQGDVSALER